MPRRSRAVAAALALVVGACSTTAPSPSPVPTQGTTPAPATVAPATIEPTKRPLAEIYGEIRTEVEGIRGLQPTTAVDPVVIDAAQLAANLEAEFDSTHDAASLKDTEDLLITLGLLPPGTSLRAATLAFQGGQVAGYYSPEKNELFVVSRGAAVNAADESTYAHEFTHQLQDQHVDLDKLGIDVTDQSDRSLARLGLVEGDATSVQTTWMTRNLTAKELGEVLAAGLDPAALEAFNNAPPYLRETALFPYQEGLAFVMRLVAEGGYAAVDATFADPPDSTEQVLHPDKYVNREVPTTVAIPKDVATDIGVDWVEVGQDTLGEFLIRTWLKIGGQTAAQATTSAAGWAGDRLALYRDPKGRTAIGWVTTWETRADQEAFFRAASAAMNDLNIGGELRVVGDEGTTVVISIGQLTSEVGNAVAGGALVGGLPLVR